MGLEHIKESVCLDVPQNFSSPATGNSANKCDHLAMMEGLMTETIHPVHLNLNYEKLK